MTEKEIAKDKSFFYKTQDYMVVEVIILIASIVVIAMMISPIIMIMSRIIRGLKLYEEDWIAFLVFSIFIIVAIILIILAIKKITKKNHLQFALSQKEIALRVDNEYIKFEIEAIHNYSISFVVGRYNSTRSVTSYGEIEFIINSRHYSFKAAKLDKARELLRELTGKTGKARAGQEILR